MCLLQLTCNKGADVPTQHTITRLKAVLRFAVGLLLLFAWVLFGLLARFVGWLLRLINGGGD
jgi:hypothetical protein